MAPSDTIPPPAQAVFDFWFGPVDEARKQWFVKDPAFDAEIVQRFGALVEQALAGGLSDWTRQPRAALARIVLLDQFTRNAFRDTARAFAGDAQALAASRDLIARGFDRQLSARQLGFVYLPFMHAEDRGVQQQSLRLYEALAAAHPETADSLEWARKHQVIVERFGRYPHRNTALGRASTAEEVEFLKQPGSGF